MSLQYPHEPVKFSALNQAVSNVPEKLLNSDAYRWYPDLTWTGGTC